MVISPDEIPRIRCEKCGKVINGNVVVRVGRSRRVFPEICPHCRGKPRTPAKYKAREKKAADLLKKNRSLEHTAAAGPGDPP